MYVDVFINDFSELGRRVKDAVDKEDIPLPLREYMQSSFDANSFFTFEMQRSSLSSLANFMLQKEVLSSWINYYKENISKRDKFIGIIAAGNIPAVGFHDLMSVLASGYKCEIKLSRKDRHLIPWMISILVEINHFWKDRIMFVPSLSQSIKMVIAAGSDSTMSIIGNNFNHLPGLLRGTRSSVAVILGDESKQEIGNLCKDIFLFYGMGCRSISRVFVPQKYDFSSFLDSSKSFKHLADNPDYNSSYRYQKALMTMSGKSFIDGGFFLLEETDLFPPPLAVIGISYYLKLDDVERVIIGDNEKIQIVEWRGKEGALYFGDSQNPGPFDYADGLDTVSFLLTNGEK